MRKSTCTILSNHAYLSSDPLNYFYERVGVKTKSKFRHMKGVARAVMELSRPYHCTIDQWLLPASATLHAYQNGTKLYIE
eukprot:5276301-Amphidinium_carterae.1